jgi:hypothetical protein
MCSSRFFLSDFFKYENLMYFFYQIAKKDVNDFLCAGWLKWRGERTGCEEEKAGRMAIIRPAVGSGVSCG